MKFLVFATGALATITARQVSVITDAVAAISSGTTSLGNAVSSFSGIGDVASLTDASQGLLRTISSATQSVNGISTLSENDALQLATPIGNLNTVVGSAIDAVIAKKSAFTALSVGPTVYNQLTQLRDAATAFSTAALSKVPSGLQPIAQGLAAPIIANINRGVEAYADQANAGSSSAAAPSSTSSAAAGTTSSAAVTTTSAAAPSGGATTTTKAPAGTTTSKPVYTGAAVTNAAGFGAVAAAAFVAVAAL